ncbi:MAG: type II toxin-antitoxin system VapC family toxin [Cytophagales bacterium]|nr:type II toxin-antitoxin system VapC family toxin [Cytophagales bacterium]
MKPTVYLDNTVISYLTAKPSRDVVTNGRKIVTQEWWALAALKYELLISDFIEQEASGGDPDAARLRLESIAEIPKVPTDISNIENLAGKLISAGALPVVARYDALHIASAAVNGVEFLVTWNYAHLANPHNLGLVEKICRDAGFEPPRIVTPDQLSITEGDEDVD